MTWLPFIIIALLIANGIRHNFSKGNYPDGWYPNE